MDLTAGQLRKIRSQANQLMGELGRVSRRRQVVESQLNDRIQKLKDQANPKIEELTKKEDELIGQLLDLVLPRYMFLRKGRTKTIELPNGAIKLRRNQTSVEYDKKETTAIIRRILKKRLARKLLRQGKYTLNLEDMPKYPQLVAKVKGLSLVNRSTLTITPSKVKVKALTRDVESLKITLPEEHQED